MQIGRVQLRAWMERSQINQRQCARLLGVSDVYISQMLNGLRIPSLEMAVNIEQHTGIQEESWLLTDVSASADQVAEDTDKSAV